MEVTITPISELTADELMPLVIGSEQDGWRMVRRLVEDWQSGANRFQRPGEILFAVRIAGKIVGVCGLNIDPYQRDDSVG